MIELEFYRESKNNIRLRLTSVLQEHLLLYKVQVLVLLKKEFWHQSAITPRSFLFSLLVGLLCSLDKISNEATP
jgi:hypothetical protein